MSEIVVEDVDELKSALMGASDGDTISLAAGTYETEVRITQDDLTLRSETPDDPATIVGQWTTTIRAHGDGVTVSDLVVENIGGPHRQGIRAAGVDITIEGNQISSNPESSAIAIFDDRAHLPEGGDPVGTDVEVRENLIEGEAAAGISIFSSNGEAFDVLVSANSIAVEVPEDGSTGTIGIGVAKFTDGSADPHVEVRGNDIRGHATGIRVFGDEEAAGLDVTDLDAGDITANENEIVGNDNGVKNTSETGTVDATCNWWGDEDGPSGEGDGDGDSVSGNVEFVPWSMTDDPEAPCEGGLGPGDPETKADCKRGGWKEYGFKNQGQCIRFVETGKDSR